MSVIFLVVEVSGPGECRDAVCCYIEEMFSGAVSVFTENTTYVDVDVYRVRHTDFYTARVIAATMLSIAVECGCTARLW
jgi:hypothetical protein